MPMQDIQAMRRQLLKKAKGQVKEEYSKRDVHIIRAVNLLDDLDSAFNLLSGQIKEWYAFHFPELGEIVRDNEKYLMFVYEIGARDEFGKSGAEEKMKGFYDNEEAIKRIVDKSKSSIGSEIEKHDLDEIKLLAANAINLRGERRALTEYIEKGMAREMPNFSVLAGPVLGARLLSKAGGMKRLAFMPSSTIQVLGAEKALFQHLRTGAKGPKHGLLYSHALVRAAKPWNRGRIARTISGKLAIAARGDYFLKEKSSDLKETANLLEKRANELSERGKRHGVSSDKEKGHKKSKGKGRRAH